MTALPPTLRRRRVIFALLLSLFLVVVLVLATGLVQFWMNPANRDEDLLVLLAMLMLVVCCGGPGLFNMWKRNRNYCSLLQASPQPDSEFVEDCVQLLGRPVEARFAVEVRRMVEDRWELQRGVLHADTDLTLLGWWSAASVGWRLMTEYKVTKDDWKPWDQRSPILANIIGDLEEVLRGRGVPHR